MKGASHFVLALLLSVSRDASASFPSRGALDILDLVQFSEKCVQVVLEERREWALEALQNENLPWTIKTKIDENVEGCTYLFFVEENEINSWLQRINATFSPRSKIIMFVGDILPKIIAGTNFGPNVFAVQSNGLIAKLSRDSQWINSFHMHFFDYPEAQSFPLALKDKIKGKMNLNGAGVKTTSFNYPPFCVIKKSPSGETAYTGFEVTLAKEVIKALNGSVVMTPDDGLLWGKVDLSQNTYVDGLFGKLMEGRTELGFAGLWMQARLHRIMDYSQSYGSEHACFVTAKPEKMPQSMAIIYAFNPLVWMFVLITVVSSCILLIVHNWVSPSQDKLPSHGHVFLLLLSIMTVESDRWFHFLRKSSLLCFLPPFVLCFFVLSKGYCVGMESLLAIPMHNPPINTLQGIAQSGIIPASKSVDVNLFAKGTTDPWLIMIRENYQFLPFSMTFKEAFTAAENKKYILIQSETFHKYTIANQFTNKFGETRLHIVEQCPRTFNLALGLPKGSILKPVIDKTILQFSAAGLINLWREKAIGYQIRSDNGKNMDSSSNEPFTLDHLQGHFLVTFGSLLGPCLMVFAFEVKIWNWTVSFIKRKFCTFKPNSLQERCSNSAVNHLDTEEQEARNEN